MKDKYNDERTTVGLVMIDNYDELMQPEDPALPNCLLRWRKNQQLAWIYRRDNKEN